MKKGVAIENITITIHGRTRGEIKATQFWRVYIDMQLEINHPTKIVWRNESIRLPSQPLPEIILDMREAYLVMDGQLVLV